MRGCLQKSQLQVAREKMSTMISTMTRVCGCPPILPKDLTGGIAVLIDEYRIYTILNNKDFNAVLATLLTTKQAVLNELVSQFSGYIVT